MNEYIYDHFVKGWGSSCYFSLRFLQSKKKTRKLYVWAYVGAT